MSVIRHTAGGVVVGPSGKVIVCDQNGDSWSLPKGGVEEGESLQVAAAREIQEESGVNQLKYITELGVYERAKIGKGGRGIDRSEIKRITMFLYTTEQARLTPQDPDNHEARWVDVPEVAQMLTHQKDAEFFESIRPEIAKLLQRKQ